MVSVCLPSDALLQHLLSYLDVGYPFMAAPAERSHCSLSWTRSPLLTSDVGELLLAAALLGRKVMTNLDSILQSRDITLTTKVHLVKATVVPVVMYGFES